jgi:predicted O-methyltransferase YrrM
VLLEWVRTAAIAARNIAVGSNLASSVLITRPRALVGYASESMFLLKAMRQQRGLPERQVYEVVPHADRDFTIALAECADSSWFGPVASFLVDLIALCTLCRLLEPRVVFEIGTLRGSSTLHLALNSPEDARVFTLDLPPGQEQFALPATVSDVETARTGTTTTQYAFSGTDVERKIQTLHGDSARFDFSPWHGKVDLFFIDGAHSYEYVRSDTEHALACVRPGGALAWHDFGRAGVNGVSRYLAELAAGGLDVFVVPGGSLAYAVLPERAAGGTPERLAASGAVGTRSS